MKKSEIAAAIERARGGIAQYLEIMAMVREVDVSTDREFQRRFNHFYRVRQRPAQWYGTYYGFMEARKSAPPRFDEVLEHLHQKLGRCEPSFSSKLAATLDPSLPVWDKFVLQHIGLKPPAYSSSNKFEQAKATYRAIQDWYAIVLGSPGGRLLVDVFKGLVPEHYRITDIKKIDFVLWQMRD